MSASDELKKAIKLLKHWYKAFPKATVIIGNHERRISKKLKIGTVSKLWLKSFADVLEVPKWDFVDTFTLDNVTYLHGDGCTNTLRSLLFAKNSIVFGHVHSKLEIMYVDDKYAMCVGWLGDQSADAFGYAQTHTRKCILGCGVVLNNGKQPILIKL